jgi:hypothetical protein
MIIPTFPALATAAKHAAQRLRTRYGWSWLEDDSADASGCTVEESELAKLRKRILPNGKTYSQSDTIDKMVFGVNGLDFQTVSTVAQQEHMSSGINLVKEATHSSCATSSV